MIIKSIVLILGLICVTQTHQYWDIQDIPFFKEVRAKGRTYASDIFKSLVRSACMQKSYIGLNLTNNDRYIYGPHFNDIIVNAIYSRKSLDVPDTTDTSTETSEFMEMRKGYTPYIFARCLKEQNLQKVANDVGEFITRIERNIIDMHIVKNDVMLHRVCHKMMQNHQFLILDLISIIYTISQCLDKSSNY